MVPIYMFVCTADLKIDTGLRFVGTGCWLRVHSQDSCDCPAVLLCSGCHVCTSTTEHLSLCVCSYIFLLACKSKTWSPACDCADFKEFWLVQCRCGVICQAVCVDTDNVKTSLSGVKYRSVRLPVPLSVCVLVYRCYFLDCYLIDLQPLIVSIQSRRVYSKLPAFCLLIPQTLVNEGFSVFAAHRATQHIDVFT